MDFFDLVAQVIDRRSFSSLWYWIALAVLWSSLAHWTLGVPFHIVSRARRGDEESQADMEALARITVRRLLTTMDVAGAFVVGFLAFLLTGLAVLGWGYGVEFCQALLLLVLPTVIVGSLSVQTARQLQATEFEDLSTRLRNQRIIVQAMGLVFIFITAFWGMYTNVTVDPLG